MKKQIITISREFGSGGRTIAKELAQQLGYKYYDNELITKIAEASGFDKEYIESTGEETTYTNSFLYNLSMNSRLGGGQLTSVKNRLFIEQFNIIRKLSQEEPCVIVGRCSDYILKDVDNAMHVHIYAKDEFRANRIVQVYGENNEDPDKRIKDKDKRRKTYYEYYTNRKWGMAKNYNLCLDSGFLGIDQCIELLIKYIKD